MNKHFSIYIQIYKCYQLMKSMFVSIAINIFKFQTFHKEVITQNKLQRHAVKGIYCDYADI